jgi:hypothetical protein
MTSDQEVHSSSKATSQGSKSPPSLPSSPLETNLDLFTHKHHYRKKKQLSTPDRADRAASIERQAIAAAAVAVAAAASSSVKPTSSLTYGSSSQRTDGTADGKKKTAAEEKFDRIQEERVSVDSRNITGLYIVTTLTRLITRWDADHVATRKSKEECWKNA